MAIRIETTSAAEMCVGYNFNVTASTVASVSAPAGARWALLTVEGAALRYTSNGVAPTVSQGMLMVSGQSRIISLTDWTKFLALQVTASSTFTAEFWATP